MKSFEKIIGYESIKNELMHFCDMLKNGGIYQNLGAKKPNGILIHGEPGLGKTLMANCFINECNLRTFTVRKTKSDNFAAFITEMFEKAKENAPSIVFLDDMDKFANEDNQHRDADEYVAIQASIDNIKNCDVFVLATANDIDKLPKSLIRAGRFDKCIEMYNPNHDDCVKIIEYYLSTKKIADNVNIDDISKMMSYSSCAELESIMNEAAIIAGYKRKHHIEMADIVSAVLKTEYNSPDNFTNVPEEKLRRIALHEAGHLVMSETLDPGSIGLASLRSKGDSSVGGFVRQWKRVITAEHHILVSLAGKAAVEITHGTCATGCETDISKALGCIRDKMADNASMGFGLTNVSPYPAYEASQAMNCRSEAAVQAEMERYLFKAKEILVNNKKYLEAIAEALLKKETLLASDIKKIREAVYSDLSK